MLAFEVKLKPVPTDRDVANLHWLGKQLGNRFKGVLLNILLNTVLSNMLSGVWPFGARFLGKAVLCSFD